MKNFQFSISKLLITLLIITGLLSPIIILAQVEPPQTLEEARQFGWEILRNLPQEAKRVWQQEALPLWQEMWNYGKPYLEKSWNWLLGLLGKEVEKIRPEIEKRIEQKKEEAKGNLWERFKDFFRQEPL